MAEEARIRFVLETAEARRQVDRFRADLTDAAQDAGKLGAEATRGFGAAARRSAALFGGAALSGFTQTLAQPGATAGQAALGAGSQVAQTALQQGQRNITQGVVNADAGQIAKGIAGTTLGVVGARNISAAQQIQAAGIGAAQQLTGGLAEAGLPVDPEVQTQIAEIAMERAFRRTLNDAQAARAAPNIAGIIARLASAGGV